MKSTLRSSFALCVVALLILTGAGSASARAVRFPRHHRPLPKPVYTAIASVNRSSMTITTSPKNSTGTTAKTYRFTPATTITINGQPGKVADLRPGQRIRVGLGADDDLAEELAVTSPPAGAGQGKGKGGPPHPR